MQKPFLAGYRVTRVQSVALVHIYNLFPTPSTHPLQCCVGAPVQLAVCLDDHGRCAR